MNDQPICADQLNLETHGVFYHTNGGTLAQLMRVGKDQYGFVYLNRPLLAPVFVSDTALIAMGKAMIMKHRLQSTNLHDAHHGLLKELPREWTCKAKKKGYR